MSTYMRGVTNGPVIGFQRSISPPRRFSYFSSSSPTPSFSGFPPSGSSFSSQLIDYTSPSRSVSTGSPRDEAVKKQNFPLSPPEKKSCMCSPSDHPGAFRCSLHKNSNLTQENRTCMCSTSTYHGAFRCSLHKKSSSNDNNDLPACCKSDCLTLRRCALGNSLKKIGSVEGEWVRGAFAARPSHEQKERPAFQPRTSRLSVMTKAEDL